MGYLPNPFSEFSDGLTQLARNCDCGGVYVLNDEFTAKCGICNQTRLTQKGIARHAKQLAEEQDENNN